MTIYNPKSRDEWLALRHKYVSSTEISALFGMSPYMTAFELAHHKQSPVAADYEKNERMEWGLYLEKPIAQKFADDYGVSVRKLNAYAVDEAAGLGASFDYEIVGVKPEAPKGTVLQQMYENNGPGVLEIKNVDYLIWRDQWPEVDGLQEAPAHIELQVQQELHCIDRKWAAIAVLVAGNSGHVLIRDRDPAVGKSIAAKAAAFWRDLRGGKLPPVTLPEDAEIIRKIYSYAEPNKVMDATDNDEIRRLCNEYLDASLLAKGAEQRKDTVKAKLLQMIGDSERVLVDGYNFSAGVVADTVIPSYTRSGYRNLRITAKKAQPIKTAEKS
jgi:putative phage-type endonuclease